MIPPIASPESVLRYLRDYWSGPQRIFLEAKSKDNVKVIIPEARVHEIEQIKSKKRNELKTLALGVVDHVN